MCWNAEVSLNTFLFSTFVLLLIVYNNYFTKYKIKEINNVWTYLFIASFIFIQLVEFFIWRNIHDKFYNNLFSVMGILTLIMQPIFSIMIISDINVRNLLLLSYLSLTIPFSAYKFYNNKIYSVKSETGHLRWKFFNLSLLVLLGWLFFLLFGPIYEKKWMGVIFGTILLYLSYYNYNNDHSMGSMWCWLTNSIIMYYAFMLLFYLPFCDKKNVC
jgi:hypothetical protein